MPLTSELSDDLMAPMIDKAGEILMRNGLITVEIPQDLARTLDRQGYYQVKSWLRSVKRQMIKNANHSN